MRLPRKLKKTFRDAATRMGARPFRVLDTSHGNEVRWMTIEEIKEIYGDVLTDEELERLEKAGI